MQTDDGSENLTRLSAVRGLLAELGVHPNRTLGQNFLVDANILALLMEASRVRPGDRVLEIGPGLGTLTRALLAGGARVVAIEKDKRLAAYLRESLADRAGLELIEGDALDAAVALVASRRIDAVVSNLPYNPGSRILMDLIGAACRPAAMTVTVQREVADRLTALPGGKAFGIMALWSQLHYRVVRVREVSENCFWPRPAVRSAIVRFDRLAASAVPGPEVLERVYALTRYAFQHRRKQLAPMLARAPLPWRRDPADTRARLAAAGASGTARPEDLGPAAWLRLAGALDDSEGRQPVRGVPATPERRS